MTLPYQYRSALDTLTPNYRLYDEYVAAEQAWTEKQNKKKETLRKTYPNISDMGRYR